jgi:Sec7-like guanine-nucleotide exchange factor
VFNEQNSNDEVLGKWMPDTVYILSFQILSLNTALHNPQVSQSIKYDKELFLKITLGNPNVQGKVPPEEIEQIYDRISRRKFNNEISLHEYYIKRINDLPN